MSKSSPDQGSRGSKHAGDDAASMDGASQSLLTWLEEVSDSPEVLWLAALAMLERTAAQAREGAHGRLRNYPKGSLRRLRSDVAQGMRLARLAVALQEAELERDEELYGDLRRAAAEAGAARRRAQTLPAERARLENAARRRAERESA